MKEKKVLLGKKPNEKKVSNGTGYEMDPTPYLGLFLPTCMRNVHNQSLTFSDDYRSVMYIIRVCAERVQKCHTSLPHVISVPPSAARAWLGPPRVRRSARLDKSPNK